MGSQFLSTVMAHYNTARRKSETGVQATACAPVFSFPAPYCVRCARCRGVNPAATNASMSSASAAHRHSVRSAP